MLKTWITAISRRPFVEHAMLTDVGRSRSHNEDACAADESAGLFVVCDGMGGAAGGEVASHMAARIFLERAKAARKECGPEWRLQTAVAEANRAVQEESLREPMLRGMGTTLTGLEVGADRDEVWIANVGDSRCYRLRGMHLEQLTQDHSFVDEQVQLGLMTEDEAAASHLKNIITRAVGSQPVVQADVTRCDAEAGDLFLLCTDGLTRELDDAEIAALLRRGRAAGLETCARELVRVANERGGGDNITVVLVGL